jgi:plastocyanin
MRLSSIAALCAGLLFSWAGSAQDITGTILIKKKLTRPSVTASVPIYQRGTSVKLGKDSIEDPVAYERSRVVVYLEGTLPSAGSRTGSSSTIDVRQVDRRFVPDLVVVPVGSVVSFPNMDPIFHNIYSLSKPRTFDLGSYDKGETRRVSFPKAGAVEVYCHLHPNMSATIIVAPSVYFAQPDHNGQYRIADVPPGHYTLVAWHKSAGYFRKPIDVTAGQSTSADFFIPIDLDSKSEAEKPRETAHVAEVQ